MKTSKYNFMIASLGLGLLSSCAHNVKKVELPTDMNPQDAISQTMLLQETARKSQADVLARSTYNQGHELLLDAREGYKDGDDNSEILEDIAFAQAYFQKAIANASVDTSFYAPILDAREMAVSAGVFNHNQTRELLKDTDDEFIDETDTFTEKIDPETVSGFQKKYLDIEVKTVQTNELGKAQKVLTMLEDRNASMLAPKSYNQALEDMLLSKNMISKSPRQPTTYNTSVYKTLRSTIMLRDVMEVISENGKSTPETAAIKIVNQNRKLGDAQMEVTALGTAVLSQADKIAFQKAKDDVRRLFTEDEAQVYQQGDKLIIRLKNMNFPVGKAVIPSDSKYLLTRINRIIDELDPRLIEVQGHTDSTGSKELNKTLSQNRADNVAKFLESKGLNTQIETVGLGQEKPIEDNESVQGRAANRRVDIVIMTKNTRG